MCAALLSATAMSCGPTPVKTVGPKDGKQVNPGPLAPPPPPNRAMILGTDTKGGSTMIPLTETEEAVTVDVMWVRVGPPMTGGASPAKLSIGPNPDGSVRLGIYEQFAGGLGGNLRAGVWLAAFISATTLNKDLTDFKFSADAQGYVDGASASALMTAGYLAAVTGTPLDPEATMTGTINPDGTVGPVGGIPYKFAASIDKGKKRLGFPIGLRYSVDNNTGENVDLVKLAKDRGAQAIEITDVYAAFKLMTGKELPRPVPVEAEEMELEDEVIAAFDAAYATWLTSLVAEWEKVVALNDQGRLPQSLIDIALVGQEEYRTAERLKSQGMASSAYQRIVSAWVYVVTATNTSDILEMLLAKDTMGAKARIRMLEGLTNQTEPVLRLIGEMRPDTMGGHMQMLSAYEKAITGLGQVVQSADSIAMTNLLIDAIDGMSATDLAAAGVADQIVQLTAPAVIAVARSVSNTQVAQESIAIEGSKDINYMCSLPNVKRLATSFNSAAVANISYFETLNGIDDGNRQAWFNREPDYITARISANLASMATFLKDEWGEDSLSWRLLELASGELTYFKTSTMVSKWYSLGVQTDPLTGRAVAVAAEKAFMNMLTSAERKARENARAAKAATGSIPVQARIAYQNARRAREGDMADKLTALELYWQSSAYAQTAVMLARN